MAEAKVGDTVKVHYTGRLNDGTLFDTTEGRDPIQFTIGEGKVIPGFEEAVVGLSEGQSQTATIQATDAYGEHRDDLVAVVQRSELPEDLEPEVGMRLRVGQEERGGFVVTVTDIGDETVTLDGNHPLAGKDLTFDIELVEVG